MKKYALVVLLLFFGNSFAEAACQVEFYKSKNEAEFDLLTNAGQVPGIVRGYPEERYGHHLVVSWTYFETREPERKNPRIYFYDQKTCKVIKVVELYPKDYNLSGSSPYYGVSYNQTLGLIYITSRATERAQGETRSYRYTEIYSYDDLSLITRLEGETPLSGVEFIDGGKKIISVRALDDQFTERKIVISAANNFRDLQQSEPITQKTFEELGIESNRKVIDLGYFEEQSFKEKGHDVSFEDQYVINLRGKDAEGKYRAVAFTLQGKPLVAVWREDGEAATGYPADYEKKFNLKIKPIKFTGVQPEADESKPEVEEVEALKKARQP